MENQEISIAESKGLSKFKISKSFVIRSAIIVAGISCLFIAGQPAQAESFMDYVIRKGSKVVLTKSAKHIVIFDPKYIRVYVHGLFPRSPIPEGIVFGIKDYGPTALIIGAGMGLSGFIIQKFIKE